MIDLRADVTDRGASICHIRFWELVKEHGLTAWCEMGWPCDLVEVPEELRTEASEWSGGCQQGVGVTVLPEHGTVAVHSRLSSGIVEVMGAGTTKQASGQAVGWSRQLLPMAEREDPKRVPIIFWMGDSKGVSTLRRTLDVPRWADIAANYAPETRGALGGLMAGFVPAKGGQLLLFHGLAGTGKTFALRAARKVGMTARGVLSILRDLEKEQIVSREKVGRHLRYYVHLRVLFAVPWRFFGDPPP